jgi:hypothetical protein
MKNVNEWALLLKPSEKSVEYRFAEKEHEVQSDLNHTRNQIGFDLVVAIIVSDLRFLIFRQIHEEVVFQCVPQRLKERKGS